jgi:16S rRNA (guanine527-N7)-methyltransferase
MDIDVHLDCLECLVDYWRLVYSANSRINLISRRCSFSEGLLTHVLDSLTALKVPFPREGFSVLDFGSGAGFPGIPLKIARREWDVCLAEAKKKTARFLRLVAKALNIQDLRVHPYHITPFASEEEDPGRFDLITVRAVGNLSRIVSFVSPFLNSGGCFLAFKGPAYYKELSFMNNILKNQNIIFDRIIELELYGIGAKRNILIFYKY